MFEGTLAVGAAVPGASAIAAVTSSSVAAAAALVVNTLKSNPQFAALLDENFDPLTTPFTANGSGIDSVLDQVAVEVGSSGVALTNLSAPAGDSGQAAPVVLTAAQTSTPTVVPTLPASEPASNLPSVAEMTAIAKKFEDCLALPLEQRVTMDANKEVTAVSAACSFGIANWKSDGGGWVDRMGNGTFRYTANTGLKAGQPSIATVLPAPNYSGNTFQHPYCNTQTCVIMYLPWTTASGKAAGGFFTLAKVAGKWEFVGNQLPYALGVEQRLNRLVAVNTALAAKDPSVYGVQDRVESTIRLTFNLDASGDFAAQNVRAVIWKGPGLPAAGVVTHRSQRCGSEDRMPITNQEGLLTNAGSTSTQWWNNGGTNDFKLDAAKLDGTALTMPWPTKTWATSSSASNQDYRDAPFTGSIPAWSVYTAEVYYYSNTGTTPDEVIMVRNGTPFERASAAASKNWPTLSQATIDAYLKPTGTGAGSLTTLSPNVLDWTNPVGGYVNFGYLFSQNRITATNAQNETSPNYWKRSSLWFRIGAAGDSSAPAYEWAPNRSGVELSTVTPTGASSTVANSNTSPNPRCASGDEVLPLDADASRSSYREIGLQVRDSSRKLNQLIHFWSN
jgi:hypothetical protein